MTAAVAAPATTPPVLALRDVRRYFRARGGVVRAVDGVDLELAAGETFGLVGESGCGKSTLARVVVGLLRPSGGSVCVNGGDLGRMNGSQLHDVRRHVQIVFQDPYSSLDPRQRVASIIAEPLEVHGVGSAAERRDRVAELLRLVGMDPVHGARFPHQFSGGQRQRIGIARALALNPRLLVCDEPVSALDVSARAQILNLLQDLQTRLGLTLLLITHDLGVVEHLCDRVGVMYLGRLVEVAPRDRLFAAAAHPYTRGLLAAVPRPDPTRRLTTEAIQGEIPSPLDPPTGCRFHPRCAVRLQHCGAHTTALEGVWPEHPDHLVACHLWSTAAAAAGPAPAGNSTPPATPR